MEILDQHPIVEDVIAAWTESLGGARAPYRGHVYRVFNCARRILGADRADDLFAIAASFHDLGIWSDHTFDYLAPSRARAREWCETHERAESVDAIELAIEQHHRLRRFASGPHADVVDAFRRADLVDLSAMWIRNGVPRAFLKELRTTFPFGGFHGIVVRTALAWMLRHPLRPMPMLKL